MQKVIDIPEDVNIAISQMGLLRIPNEMIRIVDKAIQHGTPIKTGHWIPMGLVDSNGNRNYECSECHHGDTHAKTQIVPYCWYCGAKMKGENK